MSVDLVQSVLSAWASSAAIASEPIIEDGQRIGVKATILHPDKVSLTQHGLVLGKKLGTAINLEKLLLAKNVLEKLNIPVIGGGGGSTSSDADVGISVEITWHLSESDDPRMKGPAVNPRELDPLMVRSVERVPGRGTINVVPLPRLVEMAADGPTAPSEERLWLHATLQVRSQPVNVAGVKVQPLLVHQQLPPIPIPRLVLPIPRTMFLHIHPHFSPSGQAINPTDPDNVPGAALLVVHPATGLGPTMALQAVLDTLSGLQNAFRAFAQIGGVFKYTMGLAAAQEALISVGQNIVTVVEPQVSHLNDIDLLHHDPVTNDIEVEDEVSSILITGLPGQVIHFYMDDSFDGQDDGQFDLMVGDLGFTIVGSLHAKPPTTEPPDLLKVIHPLAPASLTWHDELSSVQFG